MLPPAGTIVGAICPAGEAKNKLIQLRYLNNLKSWHIQEEEKEVVKAARAADAAIL